MELDGVEIWSKLNAEFCFKRTLTSEDPKLGEETTIVWKSQIDTRFLEISWNSDTYVHQNTGTKYY